MSEQNENPVTDQPQDAHESTVDAAADAVGATAGAVVGAAAGAAAAIAEGAATAVSEAAGAVEVGVVTDETLRADDTPRRGFRKTREGMVVSDRMKKTIVVALEDRVKHPRYAKVIRRTSKVQAHDETELAGIGDRVLLAETRPLSATKRWRLVEVLEKAQ